jgi:hypothetical protein
MTQLEFDNYKLQLQSILSKKGGALSEYLAIGKEHLGNDTVNLELGVTYLEIMSTYDLEDDSTTNATTVNFFTHDGMQNIVTHLNKICNTTYNVDLVTEI